MTVRRYELSDFEWSIIEPLLPNKPAAHRAASLMIDTVPIIKEARQ